jgi:hypothetical protein
MRKIAMIGLLVFILVVPNFLATAKHTEPNEAPINLSDDVPIWNEGNSWTFTISEFWIDYSYGDLSLKMDGRIDDFKLKVSDTSGDSYKVDVSGKITGSYEASLPFAGLLLNFDGTLKKQSNRLSGKIVFRKSNLEIEDFNAVIKGITSIAIHPIPLKFPLPIRISANADFSTLFPLFNFPLHSLKFWNMPAMDIITPIYFGGILGILKIPITFTTHYNFIPLAFSCIEKISVTVDEGTYDAWRIKSIIGDFFEYYYAPMVGNLIKVDINMPNGGMIGELKEKNY